MAKDGTGFQAWKCTREVSTSRVSVSSPCLFTLDGFTLNPKQVGHRVLPGFLRTLRHL